MSKECFVITTYCNSLEKIEELKKCINNLKKFNIDILIHAHYPLDFEIQKMVTYYIYDFTNPVIANGSKSIIRWKWYVTANKLLTISTPDYSYAVMNQWNSSLKFLKDKEYDKIHIINYDTIINNFIFRKHQSLLDDYDVVFEYTDYKAKDYNANECSTNNLIIVVFFSIKNTFVDTLTKELTLEKYLLCTDDTMLETYLMEIINKIENKSKQYQKLSYAVNSNYKIKKLYNNEFKLYLGDAVLNPLKKEDCDVYTTYSESNGFDLIKKTIKDDFNNDVDLYYVFGGMNSDYNKFEIFIFDITKTIRELIINISGNITKVDNITNSYYSLITNYTESEIFKIIDNNEFSIIIDGEIVNRSIIDGEIVNRSIIDAMKHQHIQYKDN